MFRIYLSDSAGDRFSDGTLGPLAVKIAEEFPQVERSVRVFSKHPTIKYQNQMWAGGLRWLVAGDGFEDVFDFALRDGDLKEALAAPNSVVIAAPTARSYFGEESPVGKTLVVEDRYVGGSYTITGVLKPMPDQQSWPLGGLHFISKTVATHRRMQVIWNAWDLERTHRPVRTYLLLKEGEAAANLEAKLSDSIRRTYHLQRLTDVHLRSARDFGLGTYDRIAQIWLLSALSVFVLGIACANFANLMTAQSTVRARTSGIRQVVGALRGQLVRQHLLESVLTASVAVILALGLAQLALPYVNDRMDRPLVLDLSHPTVWMLCGILALVVGVVAGAYPAIYVSSLGPTAAFRAQAAGSSRMRSSLVVLQFTASIVLITITLVSLGQMQYVAAKDLGFRWEGVVKVHTMFRDQPPERAETIKTSFLGHPDVEMASALAMLPGSPGWYDTSPAIAMKEGDPAQYPLTRFTADHDFLDLFQIPLIAGRNFEAGRTEDEGITLILNERAVSLLGYESAEAAVGESITWTMHVQARIIGVVGDFHLKGLQRRIEPLCLVNNRARYWTLALRAGPHKRDSLSQDLYEIYRRFQPQRSFQMTYFEDAAVLANYRDEIELANILKVAAFLGLMIACLGMFGLSAFAAQRREKEAGIRRVMGASAGQVAARLLRELSLPVVIAAVLAVPISYKVGQALLEPFAYRMTLGMGMFVAGGLIALVLANLTALAQVLRLTRANPVDVLRAE